MSLILSGSNGVSDIDGDASTPAIRGTDANTGIFFGSDIIGFAEGGAEAMRIDSSGNLGIGNATARGRLTVSDGAVNTAGEGVHQAYIVGTSRTPTSDLTAMLTIQSTNALAANVGGSIAFGGRAVSASTAGANWATIAGFKENATTSEFGGYLQFVTRPNSGAATERARITSAGYFKASDNGSYVSSTGSYHELYQTASGEPTVILSATNASFTNGVDQIRATRSANSAYGMLYAYSGGGSDLEFNLRGDGNGYADGTWNNNGADYAEFFESANGQALTLGATVVLDGNKVREATNQDPTSAIIGVVRPKEPSKASMVVGNTAWNKWANKYLTDDFDRYIMEDHDVVEWEETITDEEGKTSTKSHSYESHNIPEGITVPADAVIKTHDSKGNKFQHYKLNPAWNPDSEYVNRENRPEWNIIGLVGQVKVLKGQSTNDRWIKMRDVSETVEEWFIR